MKPRIVIDRLELDLRGIDPAVAEAAVRLLGPALQVQFMRATGTIASAPRIDGGHVAPSGEPQALANRLAERIVGSAQSSHPAGRARPES